MEHKPSFYHDADFLYEEQDFVNDNEGYNCRNILLSLESCRHNLDMDAKQASSDKPQNSMLNSGRLDEHHVLSSSFDESGLLPSGQKWKNTSFSSVNSHSIPVINYDVISDDGDPGNENLQNCDKNISIPKSTDGVTEEHNSNSSVSLNTSKTNQYVRSNETLPMDISNGKTSNGDSHLSDDEMTEIIARLKLKRVRKTNEEICEFGDLSCDPTVLWPSSSNAAKGGLKGATLINTVEYACATCPEAFQNLKEAIPRRLDKSTKLFIGEGKRHKHLFPHFHVNGKKHKRKKNLNDWLSSNK